MSERTDVFAVRPDGIHVANGMICFEPDGVVLKTFYPDYLSRKSCPIAFDSVAECPRFKMKLLGSALNEDDIVLLQKWAGAILMGKNAGGQFLLMLGTAGGGSTLMSALDCAPPSSPLHRQHSSKQNALNPTIQTPLVHTLAVLLLSLPVDSVFSGGQGAMIMNFFGVFLIFASQTGISGFFATEEVAVQYALGSIVETRGATSSS